MADELVTPTALTLNAGVLNPTGVTVEAANFAVLSMNAGAADGSDHTAKDQVELSKCLVRLSSVTGSATAATILAGDNPPANRKIVGDLVVALGAGETKWVVLEAANYTQSDGTVRIDSGVADLVVAALLIPQSL